MSDHTLIQITHYQKKLEKYAATGDDEKLLYCIHKLKYLPVTVNHLEITGVGKSINGLRHKNGVIGEKAKALVQKWKRMVAQEEEQPEVQEENELSSQDAADAKSQTSQQSDNLHKVNDEEYDPSDEGDRLQIEEDNVGETYNPGGLSHIENEEEPCNGYDPRTSREDYMCATEVKMEYTPTSKYSSNSQDEDLSDSYSPSVPNGFDATKKEKNSKLKEESKHKKKKHKSRHDKEPKHKSRDESSESKKSKHKSSKKEKDRSKESSKTSSSHSSSKSYSSSHKSDKEKSLDSKSSPVSHNSSHNNLKNSSINNSNNSNDDNIKISNSFGKSSTEPSDKRHKEDEVESPSSKKSKIYDDHKDRKSHKSKPPKEERKSSKKRKELEAPSEFEAALMGMEGTSSKKKKKKVKEKDSQKNLDELYCPVSSNQNSKVKELKLESREHLPSLPSSFEDDIEAPQLMTSYKPLPHVPQRPAARDPFTNQMTDEEALNFMLSSKNSKQRRIYAGKTAIFPSVPSLFDICIRVLQENIDALETMGGIPFDILKPVLEKASPQQLFALEDYNPYLLEDTDSLWAAHCRKSFKNKQREDMETWRDMFIRCTDEHQEKMRTVTENLQKKYITKAPPKRTTQLAFINTAAKLPKSVVRAQARYGTGTSVSTRPIKAEEQLKTSSSNSSSSSNNVPVPKVEKPLPNKPPTVKKPKVAPLMGKARQLMKKVCRR